MSLIIEEMLSTKISKYTPKAIKFQDFPLKELEPILQAGYTTSSKKPKSSRTDP